MFVIQFSWTSEYDQLYMHILSASKEKQLRRNDTAEAF